MADKSAGSFFVCRSEVGLDRSRDHVGTWNVIHCGGRAASIHRLHETAYPILRADGPAVHPYLGDTHQTPRLCERHIKVQPAIPL